jgi:hypothetical protein
MTYRLRYRPDGRKGIKMKKTYELWEIWDADFCIGRWIVNMSGHIRFVRIDPGQEANFLRSLTNVSIVSGKAPYCKAKAEDGMPLFELFPAWRMFGTGRSISKRPRVERVVTPNPPRHVSVLERVMGLNIVAVNA